MDLFGPQNYASLGDNKYGLVIVDDFSRYTWVFFLYDKSKVVDIFTSFAKRAQVEYDSKLKHIRSDNGTEFKNTHIEDFLDDMASLMNSLLLIHHSRMVLLKGRIVLLLKWPEQCLLNTRLQSGSGPKQSTLLAISSTRFTFTSS